MQPRFPSDHHSHRRRPAADPLLDDRAITALAARGLRDLQRHCLPAGDPSDPRCTLR